MSSIQKESSLSPFNTLGLPSTAQMLARPNTLAELQEQLRFAHEQQFSVTLMGRGSNVILAPRVEGLVVIPSGEKFYWVDQKGKSIPFESIAPESHFADDATALLHVEAGVEWHHLVERVTETGWWGIENLALIPGQVGAAPVQNIGAYGVELSDVVEEVHCVDLETGQLMILNKVECEFGYRTSIFKTSLKGRVAIHKVVFQLTRTPSPKLGYADLSQRLGNHPTPSAVAMEVSNIRRSKLPDPDVVANAGSFFKNPVVSESQAQSLKAKYPSLPCYEASGGVKLAAGWLIDQCGLKGLRKGHFGIHDKQALVVIHLGGGSASELLQFSDFIAQQVNELFGVMLEREPQVIGHIV